MKRTVFIFLLLLLTPAQGMGAGKGDFRLGLGCALNCAIGTGKGFWDWQGEKAEVQRTVEPSASVSLRGLYVPSLAYNMEGGVVLAHNRCGIMVDDEKYMFTQTLAETYVAPRIFFSEKKQRVYLTGGPSLTFLLFPSDFKNEETGTSLLENGKAKNIISPGLRAGVGMEIPAADHKLNVEVIYSTFYLSPEYKRKDGSTGNIRSHRFELGIVCFL